MIKSEEPHIASRVDAQMHLAQGDPSPPRDSASHDAEIRALRQEFEMVYDHFALRDRQLLARLRDLQAQVTALEGEHAVTTPPTTAALVSASPADRLVAYRELITRIRRVVRETLPSNATVLVVSRGDDALLALEGRAGWHFPQQEDGVYAGYYPAESDEAIAHLESLRAKGADYLLIPATSLWWLDYYKGLAHHLQSRYDVIVRQDDICWIINLEGNVQSHDQRPVASAEEEQGYRALQTQIHELVSVLLPADASVLVVSKGDGRLLTCCGDNAQHFPQGPDGQYAGFYPADSKEAIAHLETLRQQGADFLLFPSTAFWWLDYYRAFGEYLEARYQVVCRQQHVCLILALGRRPVRDERWQAAFRVERHG
jgi:hypothetical protein